MKAHLAGPVVDKIQRCSACQEILCDFSHPDWKEGDCHFFLEGEVIVETDDAFAYVCHVWPDEADTGIESCRPCPGHEACPHGGPFNEGEEDEYTTFH